MFNFFKRLSCIKGQKEQKEQTETQEIPLQINRRRKHHKENTTDQKSNENTNTTTNPTSTSNPKGEHVMKKHDYVVHYPDHPPRVDTPLYRKTHNKLCKQLNIGCFICGKNNTDNPGGEDNIITETHHYYVEKSEELAVDWIKFGQIAKNFYNPQTGMNIGDKFDWTQVDKTPDIFVDSEYNMIVLCPDHHRSSNKGIHNVPYPEWILQLAPKGDFQFLT
jgi:hypothetical protein